MTNPVDDFGERWIPFYGGQNRDLFEIERRCMDREGLVIEHLNRKLLGGYVLDIGAGDGFTASHLSTPSRRVVALEPDPSMVDEGRDLLWARGVAQDLPFHSNTFDAAYATWAFFFDGVADIDVGLAEAARVVKPDGRVFIVLNAGDDEFCSFTDRDIASDASWWTSRGFAMDTTEASGVRDGYHRGA